MKKNFISKICLFHVKNLFIVLSLLILVSCTNYRSIDNLESDKVEGRSFVKSFYEDLKKNHINNILRRSNDTLLKNENKVKFLKLLDSIQRTVGKFKAYTTVSEETLRSEENGSSIVYYRFQNKVEYENGSISEIIFFTKDNNDPLKISSVRILP